ncbi:Rha family transcriptional regulator [uncultured Thiothrix sp.]|uniref:Rha family transcriptional regulator n=1 Tax=uncultured Thiothrix sp. TaxID=223185 RepID=UPI002608C987|nr:Rha family transcriptional regulator [uncultured Thiothrix sp.]
MDNYPVNDTIESDSITPELTVINGAIYCTSLQVAEHFEKAHANVLKDIERTIEQVLENPNKVKSYVIEKLFQLSEYEITTGIGAQVKKPMYLLTRDGFTLLVMSYTGTKAMQFKLAYMEAFNRMETALKYQLPERDTLSREQLHEIERKIQQASLPFHMQESARQWMQNLLRFHLNASNLSQIKAVDYPKALLLLEQVYQYSDEYLDLRVEQEKIMMREYLGQGLPFTSVLRRQFTKTFQQRLPERPNWKEIALKLEQAK